MHARTHARTHAHTHARTHTHTHTHSLDTMVKVAGGEFAGRVKSLLTKDSINAALKANGLPEAKILEQPTSMTVGDAAASTAASMLVSRWFGVVTLVSVAISSALF